MNSSYADSYDKEAGRRDYGLNPRPCSFRPEDYAITIREENGTESGYLEVKYRVLWFQTYCREQHLTSYSIETDLAETVGNKYIQVIARVKINGEVVGSDIGGVYIGGNASPQAVQRAATLAKGRALANAGFGAALASDAGGADEVPCGSGYAVKEPRRDDALSGPTPMELTKPSALPGPAKEEKPVMSFEEARNFRIPTGSQRGRTLEQAGTGAAEYYASDRYRGKEIWTAANVFLDGMKKKQ